MNAETANTIISALINPIHCNPRFKIDIICSTGFFQECPGDVCTATKKSNLVKQIKKLRKVEPVNN